MAGQHLKRQAVIPPVEVTRLVIGPAVRGNRKAVVSRAQMEALQVPVDSHTLSGGTGQLQAVMRGLGPDIVITKPAVFQKS